MTYDFNKLMAMDPIGVVREADKELRARADKSQLERDRVAGRFSLVADAMFREAVFSGDMAKTEACDTAFDLLNDVISKHLHGQSFIQGDGLQKPQP